MASITGIKGATNYLQLTLCYFSSSPFTSVSLSSTHPLHHPEHTSSLHQNDYYPSHIPPSHTLCKSAITCTSPINVPRKNKEITISHSCILPWYDMATQHHKVALTERVRSAAMSLASSHIYSHHHYCLHHHPTSAKLGPFVAVPCSYGYGLWDGWMARDTTTQHDSSQLHSPTVAAAVQWWCRQMTYDDWRMILGTLLIEFTYHLLLACNLSNNNNTFYQTRVCIFILWTSIRAHFHPLQVSSEEKLKVLSTHTRTKENESMAVAAAVGVRYGPWSDPCIPCQDNRFWQ